MPENSKSLPYTKDAVFPTVKHTIIKRFISKDISLVYSPTSFYLLSAPVSRFHAGCWPQQIKHLQVHSFHGLKPLAGDILFMLRNKKLIYLTSFHFCIHKQMTVIRYYALDSFVSDKNSRILITKLMCSRCYLGSYRASMHILWVELCLGITWRH